MYKLAFAAVGGGGGRRRNCFFIYMMESSHTTNVSLLQYTYICLKLSSPVFKEPNIIIN